jgi:endonuclease III
MKKINDICVAKVYLKAKKFLYENGYFDEIEWQYKVDVSKVDENSFLEEYAWVVLNAGMNERIIRKIFPYICSSFFHWSSVEKIVKYQNECKMNALIYFNNIKKIDAIIDTAGLLYEKKFNDFWKDFVDNDINNLEKLPYIGPVTSYHLAKNIGFSVSKPDRHLVRLADQLNYKSVEDMCKKIYSLTDDPVSVIDVALWRYSTLRSDFYDICLQYSNAE